MSGPGAAYCDDQEQRWPLAPTTMRPLTAIGEVHFCTPLQRPVVVDWNTISPVSPSTACSLLLLISQTMASLLPSVVVEMGDLSAALAHQTVCAVAGAPGETRMPTSEPL